MKIRWALPVGVRSPPPAPITKSYLLPRVVATGAIHLSLRWRTRASTARSFGSHLNSAAAAPQTAASGRGISRPSQATPQPPPGSDRRSYVNIPGHAGCHDARGGTPPAPTSRHWLDHRRAVRAWHCEGFTLPSTVPASIWKFVTRYIHSPVRRGDTMLRERSSRRLPRRPGLRVGHGPRRGGGARSASRS